MGDIYIVAEHLNDELSDITFELLAHGKKLAASTGVQWLGVDRDATGELAYTASAAFPAWERV